LEPGRFSRLLTLVATEAGRARTPRGPGRVRVLSAEGARHLTADHVFLLGLGERSFPRLAQASPIYDEQERQVFKAAGLDFPCLGDRRPEEMLLFYTLLTRAQRRLVLSYPAVDDQGQALLPSSFLADLFTCFEENSLPVRKQRLLIEGYGREQPLSPAELRVRVAAQWGTSDRLTETLPPALASQLSQAALMAQQRFGHREFGPYDGRLDNPAIRAAIEERLGGPQVVSPTALETYIACPFRFLLEDLLHLEPLEELEEVIEGSDRGLIFHKALASLHRSLQAQDIHEPAAIVDTLLQQHLAAEVTRKTRHASPPAEVLWRLEGERLQKKAARYRPHWQNFLDRWAKLGLVPRPAFLEIPFGMGPVDGPDSFGPLVFQAEGVEIGLGGRIDRVDMAQTEHGTFFWIVDYKTGSSNYYTASDLKSFQKLQLTLYALAVERILLAGQGARPVGLAYWLVTDTGPKVVLPERRQLAEWLDRPERWQRVVQLLEKLVSDLVRHIRGGDFPVQPRSEKCTETCPYAQVCRISQSRSLGKMWEFPLPAL
jgi:ATP-dependent helicase/DNAse subunit B